MDERYLKRFGFCRSTHSGLVVKNLLGKLQEQILVDERQCRICTAITVSNFQMMKVFSYCKWNGSMLATHYISKMLTK